MKNANERYVEKSIELCNLIDYIGHYPVTYPVPREEGKMYLRKQHGKHII